MRSVNIRHLTDSRVGEDCDARERKITRLDVGNGGGDVGGGVTGVGAVASRRSAAGEGVGDLVNLPLDGVHVGGGGASELVGGALGGVVELASEDIGGGLESVVRVVGAK